MKLVDGIELFDPEDHPEQLLCCDWTWAAADPPTAAEIASPKFYCAKCGRTMELIGGQWIVTGWGEHGVKLPSPPASTDRAQ